MNKTELIKSVALSTEVDEATVRKVFNGIIDTIQKSLLYGVNIKIKDFISFVLEIRPEAQRRNPSTGEFFTIPKRYKVKTILPRTFTDRIRNKTVY